MAKKKKSKSIAAESFDTDSAKALVRKAFNAAYYASTSDSATMDFSFANGAAGFNQALLPELEKLRTRVRYELRQNSVAKGMMRTYANSCVGTGPKLSITSKNQEWAEKVERSFASWAKQCEFLRGKSLGHILHLGVRQFFPCGEYILAKKWDESSTHSVKLKYLMIRPDRLVTPWSDSSENIIGGVETDSDGKPVSYYISKTDPDVTPFSRLSGVNEHSKIPADKIIHVFYSEDPAQMRGEPWLASALPNLHKLRRYDDATIAAAIVASKFALMLTNTTDNAIDTYNKILPPGVMEINDGMATVLPPGYEASQMSPQHPSSNNSEFRREVTGNAGSAFGMPTNIANLDSSKSNFASARYDGVTMELEEKVVRSEVETLHLNPMFKEFLANAVDIGAVDKVPEDGYSLLWRWPAEQRHTDPSKAATANKTKVETGLDTYAGIAIADGKDPQEARNELLLEVKWFRENGLVHPRDAKAATAKIVDTEKNNDAKNDDD